MVEYNIGDLFAAQDRYIAALTQYKIAEGWYAQSPKKPEEKQSNCYSAIGRMFLLRNNRDSAFFYFHKGLQLAEKAKNNKLMCLLAQNLSVAYADAGGYQQAEKFLKQSFALRRDTTENLRYYLNFAQLYTTTNQADSASLYITTLKQLLDASNDLYLKASAYKLLADWKKQRKQYDATFDYQAFYMDILEEIMHKNITQSVYEVQQKYDLETLQNEQQQKLLIMQWKFITLLLLGLLASILVIFLLRKLLWQKKRLLSLKETMEVLNKTAKDLQKKQKTQHKDDLQLREVLLWKFDVLHKVSLLKLELQHFERIDTRKALAMFEEIVYGKNNTSQWNILIETINEIHPGLSACMKQNYPQFSETEHKVCVLSYAGLHAKEIALLIHQSIHTINMAGTGIRKKMNLKESGANFCKEMQKQYLAYSKKA